MLQVGHQLAEGCSVKIKSETSGCETVPERNGRGETVGVKRSGRNDRSETYQSHLRYSLK